MPLDVLSLLADVSPPDPGNAAMTTGVVILVALAAGANQVMGAFVNFRKLKGGDPLSDERYVSKAEHSSLAGTVTRLEGQIAAQGVTIATELRAINRSLGRLEGAAGTEPGR